MTNISSNSVARNQDYKSLVDNVAKDGNFNKSELGQFEKFVNNSKLPESEKQKLNEFAEKLNLATDHVEDRHFLFFKIGEKETAQKISPQDLKALEKMAVGNPIAKSLLNAFKESQSKLNIQDNFTTQNNVSSHGSSPVQTNFPIPGVGDRGSASPQQSSSPVQSQSIFSGGGYAAKSRLMPPENTANFAYNQFSNLTTASGDCGPSSALMILKANGFASGSSSEITSLRQGVGAKTSGKPPYAVDENQIARMIKNGSHGAITQATPNKHFSAGKGQELINYLKRELEQGRMPILETGLGQGAGRHYTVVTGIGDDGSIKIADPSGGAENSYSPQELATRMQNADKRGGTVVMSFQKK